MSHANAMSLCACFNGKLGAWSFLTILGPFRPNIGVAIAPCPITSIIVLGSSPIDSLNARPSPKAANIVPIKELTTSLARVPYPTSVLKKCDALPIAFKPLSLTSLKRSSDPAQRKINEPCAAGPFEPETGASKNRPPLPRTASSIRFISASARVAQSTIDLPALTPARTPSSPSKTIFDTSGVDNIEYVMPELAMTSFAVSLTTIVLSGNLACRASHFDLVRFQTMSGFSADPTMPSDSSLAAIPSPIMPNPTNPVPVLIFKLILLLLWLLRKDREKV
mmetsp:Transcript_15061/g.37098  ORF Transcript_15061/g.37098 Transcript_15061/m.37098 type:complete len:279 (-) Transcript_15061:3-839(-)